MSDYPSPTPWQPPSDYEPSVSAVEGITVFAPRPAPDEVEAAPRTFKCPQCGATTRFDVAAGGVACEHCGHTAAVQAERVGRQATEFEFTLEALSQAEHGWGVTRQVLHCEQCGAELALAEGALTATCPFCASNAVNVRAAESDQLRPRFLVPFKLRPEDVRASVRQWLGQGWYHPVALGTSSGLDRLTGVYLPFWTFDATIRAAWRAEVGHEHRESYFDSRSGKRKTRTVIRWRWQSGRVETKIDDLPVSGSSHVSQMILERLHPFELSALVNYTPDYLAGWQAHAYDVPLTDAWEKGKAAMREQSRQACHRDTGSAHVRNFSMTADFADESWRYVLLPVYLAAYRFESRVYQVMANGQTGRVAGQKPVEWWKVWLAIAGLLSPGVCLGLIGLPLLLAGGVGMIPLMLGFGALAIGGGIAVNLYQQASRSEAA